MEALLKRELGILNIAGHNKNPALIYGLLGIGYPVIIWLLGPGLAGVYDLNNFKLNVSMLGMVLVVLGVDNSLKREDDSRQMTFLQTLPVKKSEIVSAKFISVLVMSGTAIVWMNTIGIFLPIFIGGFSMDEYGALLGFFSSMTIFIPAITLLIYFFKGSPGVFIVELLSIVIWANVFGLGGFYLTSIGMTSDMFVPVVFMALALVVYFVCWWLSGRRVSRKGFPLNHQHKATRKKALEGEST